MSTGHFVSHTGSRFGQKLCWRAGCDRPSAETRNGRHYCSAHIVPRPTKIEGSHILGARHLLRQGYSLSDIAGRMGVMSSDLDLALWRAMGRI